MANVTLADPALTNIALSNRVRRLRESYFAIIPEICVERPELITHISRQLGHFSLSRLRPLDKAQLYRKYLETRSVELYQRLGHTHTGESVELFEESLFLGSTTTKAKGVLIYPEFLGLSLWPELRSVSRRQANPYYIDDSDIERLKRVFPGWLEHNITERLRKRVDCATKATPKALEQLENIQLLQSMVFFLTDAPNCISHTIPCFTKVLGRGLRAIAEETTALAVQSQTQPHTRETTDTYLATLEVCEGLIAFSHRLAESAEREALRHSDPTRAQELRHLARLYRRVPEQAATSFHEGLIAIGICWMAIHVENANVGMSLGRLDQLLYPLYAADIANGQLTPEQAVELVCCFWLKLGDHVPMVPNAGEQLFGGTGSNQAITIGGVDASGEDAVNDLTYIILRATELLGLRDPNLNARFDAKTNPRSYLIRLAEVNLNTGATPALHNDQAVITALTGHGESLAQARDYAIVGCVEPVSAGRTYGNSAAILFNLVSVLELALFDGCHRHTGRNVRISIASGDPRQFTSFEEFQRAFLAQLEWLVRRSTDLANDYDEVHRDFHPVPLLSTLFEGPLESGRDLSNGGATVNSSGATIVGFADVVDSLCAIEQLVFVERRETMASLLAALNEEFRGANELLARLRNPELTPKFGTSHPLATRTARWLVEALHRHFSAVENTRGGRYRVGYWTMTNHAGFGKLLRATPNGRLHGDNLASGITPVSGAVTELASVLNDIAALPARAIGSGMALNLKYPPSTRDRTLALEHFCAYIEGYFDDARGLRDGGMEIQFNVTSRKTFIDAMAHPETYPDLLVRVSGYTAYFKDLTPQMQREILERSEYDLFTGRLIPYPVYDGDTDEVPTPEATS